MLAIAPPFYFFFEADFLYGKECGDDERYKHMQELASRIWSALVLLLFFYWFHNLS